MYRRYTNFALEAIEQTFQGTVDFGKKVTCTIARNGDLINKIYLQVQTPALSVDSVWAGALVKPFSIAWTNSFGHALIRYVTLEVGGQKIDTHYGEWLEIWNSLTQVSEKENGYNHMVGRYASSVGLIGNADSSRIYYIPLMFWFNKNPGLSLPLIALQYHEVKINMELRTVAELVVGLTATGDRDFASNVSNAGAGISLVNAALWVDYVYLDTEERRQFAQMSHEYLIDQLQFTGYESIFIDQVSQKVRLNYNHPVKELIWTLQWEPNFTVGTAYNDWFNFSAALPGVPVPSNAVDLITDSIIILNGHERFALRPQTYFRLVQPYQSHTRIPDNFIYLYSFGLRPEEHQPSGTVNMSRIDNAQLKFNMTNVANLPAPSSQWSGANGRIGTYAPNYNVFRVMSGMGGLAYSN
jgi:hypothetical protein